MSTDYRPLKKIHARDLFSGRLAQFGVREHFNEHTTENQGVLTDGRNYLWVYIGDDGLVTVFTRYFPNGAPGKILDALSEAFDTDIVSEYEPQFWGFETREEWDAAIDKWGKENKKKFYANLLRYFRGEPHEITPGTNGMTQAEIGKRLVETDPSLLLPENKDKLLKEISSIYYRDHAVTVTLTPEEVAQAKMIGTHEDDLPSA
jgi:hypothetical protein